MKYLICSDIHGSFEACKKIISQFESFNCDKIIILGDTLYHGPRNPLPEGHNPKAVAELLNKYVAENESLEKRIQELDTIDTIRIDENRELKQRIAELESKETEKPTKYITVIVAKEINGQEYVRLDDFMSVVNDLQAQIGT